MKTATDTNGKVWTKDEIKALIERSDKAVLRGLVVLFERQTLDEQTSEQTRQSNGVGFNGTDANILSSFAKQVQSRGFLSQKQMVIARRKLVKYSGQLLSAVKTA